MSHHMPRVDTLAPNSLVHVGYTRTDASTLAPRDWSRRFLAWHEHNEPTRSIRSRESWRARENPRRTPALMNEDRSPGSALTARVKPVNVRRVSQAINQPVRDEGNAF
ncbi:uncharacterized protein LOC116841789 [Odontomachus brunneus]|uniref:uncharacterized protein LOC116841789 n=1 Tax=Odontomachus brunneus TaxID=486640 RepID=UPI0013F263E8|nr:uncharacterized protein LOC116841789 [Odontomachus brunneus]